MKTITIPIERWQIMWMNLTLQSGLSPSREQHNSIHQELEEKYSIDSWGWSSAGDIVIRYTDERLITMFILKWT